MIHVNKFTTMGGRIENICLMKRGSYGPEKMGGVALLSTPPPTRAGLQEVALANALPASG